MYGRRSNGSERAMYGRPPSSWSDDAYDDDAYDDDAYDDWADRRGPSGRSGGGGGAFSASAFAGTGADDGTAHPERGGRIYDDETWDTRETPAAVAAAAAAAAARPDPLFPRSGQTGGGGGRRGGDLGGGGRRRGGGGYDEDETTYADYTYANEGRDETVMTSYSLSSPEAADTVAPSRAPRRKSRGGSGGGGSSSDGRPRRSSSSSSPVPAPPPRRPQRAGGGGGGSTAPTSLPAGVTARDRAEDEAATLRLLAHQLSRGWGQRADRDATDAAIQQQRQRQRGAGSGSGGEGEGEEDGSRPPSPPDSSYSTSHATFSSNHHPPSISPSLERRLRDFRFAQAKRRDRTGGERPWGILGLYDHLQGVRIDVEWAEDAAWRREHGEPYLSWADFEDSRNAGFDRPWFTYLVLVACTAVLVVSIGLNGWTVEPLNVNPMIGPSADTLIRMGAKQTSLIVNGGEWYRLFTPMVLHAGIVHYLLNMLALWFIGSAIEQAHGWVAAFLVFFISAVGGNILSAIFLPEYISVGASGGIFGLIGACVADIAINWNLLFSRVLNQNDGGGTRLRHFKVLAWLVLDVVVNCLVGLTPFVDNFTHLGGMVYGFLCGLSVIDRLHMDFFGKADGSCARIRNYGVRFFGLILSIVLIMVSTGLLVDSDGGTSPCSGCRYLSCVPMPFWADEDSKWWYCDDCDRVSGDVTRDNGTGLYESLLLFCPDGEEEVDIDLAGDSISDPEWLRKKLPQFCRKHCENLFYSGGS